MEHDFTEKELKSSLVFRGQLLEVRSDEVCLPDNSTTVREYIRHPGAVIVIAMPGEGRVLMERQFRYPLGRHFYELPAGKIDDGEDHLQTAKRELREETGYEAQSWRHLGTTHPCVGYSDERIELYLARGLRHVGHARDETEFLEVFELAVSEAFAWVRSGKITDSKTIVALFWLQWIIGEAGG